MDTNEKIKELCKSQECIMSFLSAALSAGAMNADSREVGNVADIVKDLTASEASLRESEYYKKVTEAMDDTYDARYGYSPRMTGNIRYGFNPMMEQKPYIDGYLHNPEEFRDNMHSRYGYGDAYDGYKESKRWYTETKSTEARDKMTAYTKQHLGNTVATLKEMWNDSTPENKVKMKTELMAFIEGLS